MRRESSQQTDYRQQLGYGKKWEGTVEGGRAPVYVQEGSGQIKGETRG